MSHDDYTHRDRDHRRSRPFASDRRPRGGDDREDSLFDRIMRDVASWFDDDDRERGRYARERHDRSRGGYGRGASGRRLSRDSRFEVDAGDDDDDAFERQRRGAPLSDRDLGSSAGHEYASPSRGRGDDDYDDEESRPGSFRGRGPKGYRRSDERLTELVNEALHDDDRVDAGDIDVAVENGEVTLSGQVASRRHKHRAENVASRVSGVHDVENRLRVRRDDEGGRSGADGDDERDTVSTHPV